MDFEKLYEEWLDDIDSIETYGVRTGLKGFCSGVDFLGTFGERFYKEYKRERGLLSNDPGEYSSFRAKTLVSGCNDIEERLKEDYEEYGTFSRIAKWRHFHMGMVFGVMTSFCTLFGLSALNGVADIASYYDSIRD